MLAYNGNRGTSAATDDGVDHNEANHSGVPGLRHRRLEVDNRKQIGVFLSFYPIRLSEGIQPLASHGRNFLRCLFL